MHDEDIQATSVDHNEESLGSTPSPKKVKQQPPEALLFQELIAEAYKSKMGRLKRGSASGITGDFPSAASLFFEDTEVTPPPRLDFSSTVLKAEEMLPRAICLAHLMRVVGREVINGYLDDCQAGRFGSDIAAFPDPNDEVFSALIKALACANLCLVNLEQVDSSSPDWVKEFLGTAVTLLDNLVIGPPSHQFMQRLNQNSISEVCREFTASLSQQLGFGTIGDQCWNQIYFKIKGAGQSRYGALCFALNKPIEEIAEVIEFLQ